MTEVGFPDWQRGEPVSHREVIGDFSTQDGTKYVFYTLWWKQDVIALRVGRSLLGQMSICPRWGMTPEPYYQTLSCSVFIPSVSGTWGLCHFIY